MNIWLVNAVLAFVFSVFLAGVVIPKILLIAFRLKLFDQPDGRKIHRQAIPRLGGLAFLPVIFFVMAFMFGLNLTLDGPAPDADTVRIPELLAWFCASLLLYTVGMADDLVGTRYRAKFLAQVLCAAFLISGGVWVDDFYGVLGIHALPRWIAWPFTVLLVVFIVNAVNLIDGIDGLASGLGSIAFLIYGTAFFSCGEYIYALLSFATLGVLVPFFYYNVFGNAEREKKIFMGDTGSLTVGLTACFLGIRLMHSLPEDGACCSPAVLAFSPLLIPCLDVVRVYFGRMRNGRNPFLPDKTHIHHKLLACGMTQKKAMAAVIGVSGLTVACNILASGYADTNLLLAADAAAWIAGNILLDRIVRKRKAAGAE